MRRFVQKFINVIPLPSAPRLRRTVGIFVVCLVIAGVMRPFFALPTPTSATTPVAPAPVVAVSPIDPLEETQRLQEYFLHQDDPDYLKPKYFLAYYLYKTYDNQKALALAITYATKLGNFDDAARLLKELPDIGGLQGQIDIPVLMKLLLNTTELTFARLKQIKEYIESLHTQGYIDTAEYTYYFFIITLIKGDTGNARYYLSLLKDTPFHEIYTQLINLEALSQSYPEAPEYYLHALRGMYLYQQGRRGPSLHIGQQIRQTDPQYLLSEQLIAYSSLSLEDRKQAISAFQHLQQIDDTYLDMYQFFEGIAHYHAREYNESILLFQNITTTSVYAEDMKRYLFLAYVALGDYINAGKSVEEILQKDEILLEDAYTIFDTFFYIPHRKQAPYVLYEKFPELIDFTISKCQHAFPNTLYVCLYGKAGKYVADGDTDKALAVLQRVVKRYPRSELYTMIGDLYVEQGESALANDRYNQAFVLSETELSDRVTPGT